MQDSCTGIQEGSGDQMVTMAAPRIFFAAEQYSSLMQRCGHEAMDSMLMPGALPNGCVIQFPVCNRTAVITGGIARTAAQRVSGPLVRQRACRQQCLEGFPVKVRNIAAVGRTSDIEDQCGVVSLEQPQKLVCRHVAVADGEHR